MSSNELTWPLESICMQPSTLDVQVIAANIYDRTCRINFEAPGFCVTNVGSSIDSVAFRQLMVDLKCAMARLQESRSGSTLNYLSAARFDQQESTRPHLDAGPDECFLMLGYEPSNVDAELEMSDFSKCAFDLGLTPKEFMSKHNPMFQSGFELLRRYSTRIPCFSRTDYQIVCVNNSSATFTKDGRHWQGILHTATIPTPDESERRVINSTMIALAPKGTPDRISESQQAEFVTTSRVARRGYDKQHLEDDT